MGTGYARRPIARGGRRTLGLTALTVLTLVVTAGPALADPPAGGASSREVVLSAISALLFLAGAAGMVAARRRGQLGSLDRFAAMTERVSGLPGWAAVPLGVAGVSLVVAVVGFYWDVATHIDHGRDEGVFGNAAHWPILLGLTGLAVAGLLSVLLASDEPRPGTLRVRPGWHVSTGGALLLLCGVVALVGFPIDDLWHRIFGQDVTLWSPPHIQMVAGASLCTLAMWMLFVEAERVRPQAAASRRGYLQEVMLAGAVLIGLSTLQGEFDFGVPQFRLLYQPVLLAVAAGIALVPARIRLGRGGALLAVAFFLVLRGSISVLVTGVFEHLTFHLPLYLGAAVAVELIARWVPTDRQLTFGAVSGLGIATLGLAVEAVWSHVWMPVPWPATLLPEVLLVALPAGVAAGVVGGLFARSLTPPDTPRERVPSLVAPAAAVAIVLALAYPLPTTGVDAEAHLQLVPAAGEGGRHAQVLVEIRPPEVTEGAEWLDVISWQGAEGGTGDHTRLQSLERVGEGTYRTTQAVPIDGDWKSMVRLHNGRVLAAAPIFLPQDRAIPAPEVPAEQEMVRDFVPDEEILLREMRPAPAWTTGLAHGLMAVIAAAWAGAFAFGARHLRRTRPAWADDESARSGPRLG